MTTSGINIRQSSGQVIVRASLKDSDGAKVTTGSTELRIYELQDDGSLKIFDFSNNEFTATDPTLALSQLTHRTGNPNDSDDIYTGIWTKELDALTDWVAGNIYIFQATNTLAFPESQEREIQFGNNEVFDTLALSNVTISPGVGTHGVDIEAVDGKMAMQLNESRSGGGLSIFGGAGSGANALSLTTPNGAGEDASPVVIGAFDADTLGAIVINSSGEGVYIGALSGTGLTVTGSDDDIDANLNGSVASVTARVTANADQVNGSAPAAVNLALGANTIVPGTVDTASFAATVSRFETDTAAIVALTAQDHFENRIIIFTSGTLKWQAVEINGYSIQGSNARFTVSEMTSIPANDVTFIIV